MEFIRRIWRQNWTCRSMDPLWLHWLPAGDDVKCRKVLARRVASAPPLRSTFPKICDHTRSDNSWSAVSLSHFDTVKRFYVFLLSHTHFRTHTSTPSHHHTITLPHFQTIHVSTPSHIHFHTCTLTHFYTFILPHTSTPSHTSCCTVADSFVT